jgi:hypothetical protein
VVEPALPIVLQIGSTSAEVGCVHLPLVSTPAGRDAIGMWQIDFHVDHAELRRRIAVLLRSVADEFEKVPADGD